MVLYLQMLDYALKWNEYCLLLCDFAENYRWC